MYVCFCRGIERKGESFDGMPSRGNNAGEQEGRNHKTGIHGLKFSDIFSFDPAFLLADDTCIHRALRLVRKRC